MFNPDEIWRSLNTRGYCTMDAGGEVDDDFIKDNDLLVFRGIIADIADGIFMNDARGIAILKKT